MNDLYNRIEALCLQNNVSITKMCKDSGASRGSLTDLKSERINCLNSVTLAKIATYFGVTVDYLLGKKNKPTDDGELMDAESVHIRALISAAPEWKRKAVLAILEAEDNPQ